MATDDFLIKKQKSFLLLNQEHDVNNERLQSIQPVCHSKRTHRIWPIHKERSARKRGVSRAKRAAGNPVSVSYTHLTLPTMAVV